MAPSLLHSVDAFAITTVLNDAARSSSIPTKDRNQGRARDLYLFSLVGQGTSPVNRVVVIARLW